jgi:hypothetical protein
MKSLNENRIKNVNISSFFSMSDKEQHVLLFKKWPYRDIPFDRIDKTPAVSDSVH